MESMKKLLPIFLVLQSSIAISQIENYYPREEVDSTNRIKRSYKLRGFIDGIRLDSLDARYATFFTFRGALYFDYGQDWIRESSTILKDNKGTDLYFNKDTEGFFLNFFEYNGWEFVNSFSYPNSTKQYFILKKTR